MAGDSRWEASLMRWFFRGRPEAVRVRSLPQDIEQGPLGGAGSPKPSELRSIRSPCARIEVQGSIPCTRAMPLRDWVRTPLVRVSSSVRFRPAAPRFAGGSEKTSQALYA